MFDSDPRSALAVERAIRDEIEKRALQGVHDDEASALALNVERSRLVLYGSLAAMIGTLTAVWTGTRPICVLPIGIGVVLLQLAAGLGWNGLIWASTERTTRITRKHQELFHANAVVFEKRPIDDYGSELVEARREEKRAGQILRACALWGQILASFGVSVCLIGIFIVLNGDRCWAPLWSAPLRVIELS